MSLCLADGEAVRKVAAIRSRQTGPAQTVPVPLVMRHLAAITFADARHMSCATVAPNSCGLSA
jgi:hypothetical protein